MILVTGATGTVGREVLRLLVARGAAVRAMTRNPANVPGSLGVDIARADFDDSASLRAAVAGAERVFLLTAPASPATHHDVALLDAAVAAGVSRVVKLSAIGTGETDAHGREVGAWHRRAEEAVRASPMAWTVLRPSSFASNTLHWAAPIRSGNPIPNLTGDGRQGVIDPRDVAAVAVEALTCSAHTGQTYTLTGPELLAVPDQAAQLQRLLGTAVTTVDMPLDVARKEMLASGMDTSAVDVIITGSGWARAGHNAILTDDVPRLLGRPATSFEAWALDHLDTFTGA
ncbi:NAD(P)H-binding protein [Frankia sp. CNm7]|uniref:NAD(P)H-binding protein n=1 Tax=Frankia nepalensis TaxID=1836974 RepID=A0A937RB01_9ACTN|nr:NAD(P)H-binding protein [Frankia nepalensis]MBL7500388.1 NAD(P)H-binding protein [Frankia nepalensis]MBL7508686.1 NAD(P)H-binding protein [Frankia nepalensis]MBL7518478.1 NAD(P)H-binding protein [Frankia nepalensis]MBL7628848.1 NAD(P)H-binding protein [Frankia nepalensis]